jgi:hypothetical protein
MKKAVGFIIVALLVSLVFNYMQCSGNDVTTDTVTVERTDTLYVTKKDTVPVVSKEMVVNYVKVPVPADSAEKDSIPMEVVQRSYTDDSTYTAYVSGIKYQQWPKLDSILVRQREITNTIRETVTIRETRKAHWNFGVQAGLGVGLLSGRVEPYIGAGVGYSW